LTEPGPSLTPITQFPIDDQLDGDIGEELIA
jgi:hypothetical protein